MNPKIVNRPARRVAWAIVLVFSAAVIFTGIHLYRDEVRIVRHHHAENLRYVASLKAQLIESWRTERLDDARMNSTGILRILLNELAALEEKDAPQRALILDRMRFFVEHEHLKNMILTDPQGRLLISVNPEMKTLPEDVFPLVNKVIGTNDIVFDEMNLCSIGKTLHIDAGGPVRDAAGEPIAVLVLRSDPKQWLFPVLALWPGQDQSAETILFRIEGEQFVFLCNLKFSGDAPLTYRKPIGQSKIIQRYVQDRKPDVYEGRDYRDVSVLADIRPIEGSSWLLMTKIDTAEIDAETVSK